MPPFQSRSTSASRIAFISCAGVSVTTESSSDSAVRTCGVTGIAFRDRENTPPPSEIRLVS